MARRDRAELVANLTQQANQLRDTANEMALMFDGCDDPTYPYHLGVFRDYHDFVDRVARPLVEDDDAEQAAMALYRKASPYFICACLVMLANRLTGEAPDGE